MLLIQTVRILYYNEKYLKLDCKFKIMELVIVSSFRMLYLLEIHIAIFSDKMKWCLGNKFQHSALGLRTVGQNTDKMSMYLSC